jgi:DNA-binding LacI/PurR family transcriptional regulator
LSATPQEISSTGGRLRGYRRAPAITVVAQPVAELGRAVGSRLLARLRGDDAPPRRTRLRTELIVRASCGPVRGRAAA